MEHLKAIGKGLAVMAVVVAFGACIFFVCEHPFWGLPPVVLVLAWVIGDGPDNI